LGIFPNEQHMAIQTQRVWIAMCLARWISEHPRKAQFRNGVAVAY